MSIMALVLITSCSNDDDNVNVPLQSIAEDFDITGTTATYDNVLEQIVMTIEVAGIAGNTVPITVGQFDGAPVFRSGYASPNLHGCTGSIASAPYMVTELLGSSPDAEAVSPVYRFALQTMSLSAKPLVLTHPKPKPFGTNRSMDMYQGLGLSFCSFSHICHTRNELEN